MLLKVRLVGSGTPQDSYRVNLPTYQLHHGNITQGYAIVTIPDNTHPLTPDDLVSEPSEATTEGPLYERLSDANRKKLHDHFDEHYAEHKGKFRFEEV